MSAATPMRTTAFVLVGLAPSASLGIAGEQSEPVRDRLAPTISPQGFDSQAVAAAISRAAPGDTVQLAAGQNEQSRCFPKPAPTELGTSTPLASVFSIAATTRFRAQMTDEEITKLLFCCDEPCPADVAMVFGAANETDLGRRTIRGVELYRSGFVPKLLVTGGGVLARTRPEAKRMAEIARELGVPTRDLLVEDRSANTFENIDFSVALLDHHWFCVSTNCGFTGCRRHSPMRPTEASPVCRRSSTC